ncbi:hypothetical protein GCM10022231_17740 [Gordonia caeni]|uniref:Iron chelate uptake ABC transporter family permease subunit n=1 Tax=Gordonia caeni TaxID=1007097 RepID=A0ABP7P2L8_9ACTN
MTATESPARPPALLRVGAIQIVVARRSVIVGAILLVVTLSAFVAAMALGEPVLSIGRLLDVLSGGGTRAQRILVLDLRANRTIVAALAGAALGIAGAIMQTVSRNPLASPDILGITAGASAGAVVVIVTRHSAYGEDVWLTPVGAMIGGLVIAAAIAAFSSGMDPLRLVLAGIALSALCTALITFLLTVVDTEIATSAYTWLAGSLNGRGPQHIWPVAAALVVAALMVPPLTRPASMLSLGTVRAQTLGVPVRGPNAPCCCSRSCSLRWRPRRPAPSASSPRRSPFGWPGRRRRRCSARP